MIPAPYLGPVRTDRSTSNPSYWTPDGRALVAVAEPFDFGAPGGFEAFIAAAGVAPIRYYFYDQALQYAQEAQRTPGREEDPLAAAFWGAFSTQGRNPSADGFTELAAGAFIAAGAAFTVAGGAGLISLAADVAPVVDVVAAGTGESFVGPATGTLLEPGLQASGAIAYAAPGVAAPEIIGVATGAGAFLNPLTNLALPPSSPAIAAPAAQAASAAVKSIAAGLTAALKSAFSPKPAAAAAPAPASQPLASSSTNPLAALALVAGALALLR
jgi:hypothetical protein